MGWWPEISSKCPCGRLTEESHKLKWQTLQGGVPLGDDDAEGVGDDGSSGCHLSAPHMPRSHSSPGPDAHWLCDSGLVT